MAHPYTIVIASEIFYPLISGVAVMTDRLAHHLATQGHRVIVITPSRTRSKYREQRRGYTIQRIPSWPNPLRKGLRFAFFPRRHVRKILEDINPDIVHIHDPALTSVAVADYCKDNHIPVVVTHHFTYDFVMAYFALLKPLQPSMEPLMEKMLFMLYNRCNVLTVPTETMRRELVKKELNLPVRVISNGVDMQRFAKEYDTEPLLTKYRLPKHVPIITNIGRMDREKNLETLLRALAVLKKKKLPFQAVLVGSGNNVEELRELAKELKITRNITWIPRIDHQSTHLNQLFQVSRVFCIPSPTETESIVTMEAMAAGVPVIAAKKRALCELVDDGATGYLLEPDDVKAWAKHIQILLQDKELGQKMGKAGKQKVRHRDISVTLPRFERIYQELLTSGNRQGA